MDTQLQGLNRRSLAVILTTTFLNVAGYGLIIPVAPFLIARYVSDPNQLGLMVGLLTTVYAVCQFIAAPALGVLSDRFGRRPILLLCLLGSAAGFLLLGIGGALAVLFIGRILDGLTGANTSVIMAYIADITPPKERSRYFGWIGALEGLGIITGPTVGGLLARFGVQIPFFAAAAVALSSVMIALLFMPESLPKMKRTASMSGARLNPLAALRSVLALPHLRWLLVASFLFVLPGYILQSNLGLFAIDSLKWDADAIGALFTVFGIASILIQGVLLQLLLKRFSAIQLSLAGLCIAAVSLLMVTLVAQVDSAALLYAAMMLMAVGDGLASPNLFALISQGADARSQGMVQGGNKSMQSLAGILGPVLAGVMYDVLGHGAPYIAGAGMFILTAGAVLLAMPSLRRAEDLPATEDA